MYGFLGFSRTIQALIVLIFFYSIFPFLSFIQVHAFMRSTHVQTLTWLGFAIINRIATAFNKDDLPMK